MYYVLINLLNLKMPFTIYGNTTVIVKLVEKCDDGAKFGTLYYYC